MRRGTEWHERAACRPSVCSLGSEAFIPPIGGNAHPTYGYDPDPALHVCEACPVKTECAADCARNNIRYGVWGGRLQGMQVEKLTRWGPYMRADTTREPHVA